jgi:SAM-dependent methyltransferase
MGRNMLSVLRRIVAQSKLKFPGSAQYWERRYANGGTSGQGSYSEFAEFKADFLNRFVAEHEIRSVVELGCGDGNQLSLAKYPQYVGIDISPTAVNRCSERFRNDSSKSFFLAGSDFRFRADLSLSLDVIYHLVEDEVFVRYMADLFAAATRYVIIYSSDQMQNRQRDLHVRHRPVSDYVANHFPDWRLEYRANNPFPPHPTMNFAEFIVFAHH